jgi:hypothetical protein
MHGDAECRIQELCSLKLYLGYSESRIKLAVISGCNQLSLRIRFKIGLSICEYSSIKHALGFFKKKNI